MLVKVEGLRKEFESVTAVDGLEFELKPGRIYAFVGPNGAGKTTTMRMLATLEMPTAGEVTVDGMSLMEHPYEIRKVIGYMPDHFGIYPNLTVRDYLEFYARAYGVEPGIRRARLDGLMEFTGLDKLQDKMITTLSKGMMQRLNMGRGLLNDPKLLILDEPAAGLDPRARIELRFLLKQLAGQGKTIFISSHILSELAEMCDAMLIIDRGRQISFGGVDDIQRQMRSGMEVQVRLAAEGADALVQWLLEREHVSNVRHHESGKSVTFSYAEEDDHLAELLRGAVMAGHKVLEFRPMAMTMEEVFMQITGDGEGAE